MSRLYDPVEIAIGTDSLSTYTFDFKIEELTQLLVIVTDDLGEEVQRVRGDDTTYLDSVDFNAVNGGGTVNLIDNLPNNYTIFMFLADDEPTQPFEFKSKASFTLDKLERALDWLSGQIQRLSWLTTRGLRLNDTSSSDTFDGQLPVELLPRHVLIIGDDGDSIDLGPDADDIAGAADAAAAAIAAAEAAEAAAALIDVHYNGYSARFSEIFVSTSLQDTLDKIIIISYAPPSLSLAASGNGTVREKGTAVTSSTLTATVVKKSDPIQTIRYYKGVTLLSTTASPNPAGGTDNYAWTGSFSDNTTFNAEVDDDGSSNAGVPQTVSASASFTFVYPYYYGAGAAGLTPAQVAALTKDVVVSNATKTVTFTASNSDVFYFAYPASYGVLTSILDVNGFETFPDWTKTVANITGLDASAVSYNIYAFNNPVVAGSYQYTFKR